MEQKSLCDRVRELANRYPALNEKAAYVYHKAINEPKRLYGRLREDPWYFASVGSAFLAPTLMAGIAAYGMKKYNYPQDTITSYAIWTKNVGFFVVNVPMHL